VRDAQVIADYLESNPPTQHLNLGVDELTDLVRDLDLVLLNARLESDPQLGTPRLYMRLRRMLKGYLESSV